MRFAILSFVLIAFATPALADDAPPSVVVLRGSSAPPTPWYEPPPAPTIVLQPVYLPVYYPVLGHGAFVHRHGQPHGHGPTPRRNR